MTDNELVELLEDRLPADRRAVVLAELDRCSACRALAQAWASTSLFGRKRATPATEDVPARVGTYELRELIGSGAMGLVFRARDTALDRDVAVKLVRASHETALDEGRLLATVRHPNVITVYAAGAGDDVAFLAMELVDGTSLDRVLRDRPPSSRSPATLVRWFRGVASGLAAAHDAGVVHRDIKPANLLVDGDRLRIADFGLASTGNRAPAGTPAYLAPELARAEAATPASDQFAYCVTLFEALSGRRPFGGSDLAALRESWSRPIADWSGIPSRIRRVLARGLAADPAERWPDMRAVESALGPSPARWPWAAAAAIVIATAFVAIRAARSEEHCTVPALGWTARDPAFARYEARWREVFVRACGEPRGDAMRACLERARARVELSLGDASTLAKLPGPERCLSSPDRDAVFDPRLLWIQTLADAGRTREARAALPPPGHDTPELAFLRGVIANDLLDFDAAEEALRHALELATSANDLATLADAQRELAIVVGFSHDRHEAGAAYAESARATAERIGDPRRVALANVALGLVLASRGDDNAVATITAAVDALAHADPDPLELSLAEKRAGWVLNERHRGAEARVHFARARALRASILGENSPAVALIDNEIALSIGGDGDYAGAIRMYRDIIARLSTLGPNSYELQMPLGGLGTAQLQSGDYAGAEASFRRALELRIAKLGPRHTDVGRAYINIASACYYQGKYDEAIASYRSAEAVTRSALGGKHPEVATIESGLAIALQGANRLDEARTAITRSIDIFRESPGHDKELGDALMNLGVIELAGEHYAPARAALEESYAIERRIYGDEHIEVAPILGTLGELYFDMNRLDDAWRAVDKSRQIRIKFGAAPQLVAENDFVLALIADKQGKRADARKLAEHARTSLGTARPDLKATIEDWLKKH